MPTLGNNSTVMMHGHSEIKTGFGAEVNVISNLGKSNCNFSGAKCGTNSLVRS